MIFLRFIGLVVSDLRKSSSVISGYRILSSYIDSSSSAQLLSCAKGSFFQSRSIHSSSWLFKETTGGNKSTSDTIQLLGINGELRGVMKLRKAESLAKEEHLKLLRVDDNASLPTLQPTYRLISAKEFAAEQKKLKTQSQAEKLKPAKSVKVSSAISSHDLGIKINHIIEWIGKGHDVKVTIQTGKSPGAENRVFDEITKSCKEVATIQNSKKTETELVFKLMPKKASVGNTSPEDGVKPLKLDELKKMQIAEVLAAKK